MGNEGVYSREDVGCFILLWEVLGNAFQEKMKFRDDLHKTQVAQRDAEGDETGSLPREVEFEKNHKK